MKTVLLLVVAILTFSSTVSALAVCLDLPRIPDDFVFNTTYVTTQGTSPEGEPTYQLSAIVDWSRFNSTGVPKFDQVSGYAVRLVVTDVADALVIVCVHGFEGYQYTSTTSFTFTDLHFGYRYQFRIRTADITTNKTSAQKQTFFTFTPDCLEVTGDEEFCLGQTVEYASKPRSLSIDCSEKNLSLVRLSWLAPLQINGTLTSFAVEHSSTSSDRNSIDTVAIDQDLWNGSSSFIFNTTIADLVYDQVYTITVTPIVDGSKYTIVYNTTIQLDTSTFDQPCSPPTTTHLAVVSGPGAALPTGAASSNSKQSLKVEPALLAGVLCAFVVFVLLIAFCTFVSRRRLSSSEKAVFVRYPDEISTTYSYAIKKEAYNVSNVSATPLEVEPIFQKLEFDRSLLKIEEILGSGQFGTVYKGFAYGLDGKEKYISVAVKSLRENATRSMKEDFLDEIKLIVEIGHHPNILPILGCCTAGEPYYLITELMQYGDLLHFLWKCREEKNAMDDPIYKLTSTGQLQIAIQIARGMEYLSTTMYYHGDLAARNVLVGQSLICKISDFGLADDIYQRGYKRLAPERKRPVKWVSLETNTQGKCSIQSDVWSFGIVLYEIYTLGGVPYPGMDGRHVITKVQQGYRMERPNVCPLEIYGLMQSCWMENPHSRPSFTALYETLDAMLTENVDYLTELETDLSNYEFVPCMDSDRDEDDDDNGSLSWGEVENENERGRDGVMAGERGLLSAAAKDVQVRLHNQGKDCKFENAGFSTAY